MLALSPISAFQFSVVSLKGEEMFTCLQLNICLNAHWLGVYYFVA